MGTNVKAVKTSLSDVAPKVNALNRKVNIDSRSSESIDVELDQLCQRIPWLKSLLLMLSDLRYGSVNLTVQDGKVIQLDRVEKVRLC